MPRSLSERLAGLERDTRHSPRSKKISHPWLKHVDVVDFLENFHLANIKKVTSDEVQFSCPFPGHSHGDATPSAYMNDGSVDPDLTTKWKCWGCGRSGTAIAFVAEHENISNQAARRQIKEHYAAGWKAPRYGSISREFEDRYKRTKSPETVSTLAPLDPEILFQFQVDWSYHAEENYDQPDVAYMLDRGFTPGDLDDWGVGFDSHSQRITIPVCAPDGTLVGFKGRAWRPRSRPKYLVLGDVGKRQHYGFRPYEKSLVVFGLDRFADSDTQNLVLVEGEIDVMSLGVMGVAAVSIGGSKMSIDQARLIRQHCDEIVLFFDNDAAGRNGVRGIDKKDGEHKPGIIELLEPFIRVRIVGKHRHDPNDYLRRGEQDRALDLISSAKSSLAV